MTRKIEQKSLFGAPSTSVEKVKIPPAPKPPLPKLGLESGFDNTELRAESVFWLRLILGQNARSFSNAKARKHFIKAALSELKIKQGLSTPENIMRDMLLTKNLS